MGSQRGGHDLVTKQQPSITLPGDADTAGAGTQTTPSVAGTFMGSIRTRLRGELNS